jgi:hypothetical protein
MSVLSHTGQPFKCALGKRKLGDPDGVYVHFRETKGMSGVVEEAVYKMFQYLHASLEQGVVPNVATYEIFASATLSMWCSPVQHGSLNHVSRLVMPFEGNSAPRNERLLHVKFLLNGRCVLEGHVGYTATVPVQKHDLYDRIMQHLQPKIA